MLRVCFALVILLAAIAAGGCGPPAAATRLTERDSGQTVALSRASRFDVVVEDQPPGLPAEGYGWEWEQNIDDNSIFLLAGEPIFKETKSDDGRAWLTRWPFETQGTGRARLKLVYHRVNDWTEPPLKTLEVQLVVR